MELQDMAGHVIRRLHQMSTQVFQARMRDTGVDLTPVQFAALHTISEHPGIDQATVAATIAYDRATIGGVTDRLEQKGLVERTISSRDRRARELRLSPAGKQLLESAIPVVKDLQDDILPGLSEAERVMFLRLGRKVLAVAGPDDGSA